MDAMAELQKLQTTYTDDGKNKTFNAIVYGDIGTGKTRLLETCPGPVLVHSFDPGGTLTLRKSIEAGHVYVDTRFEKEDAKLPSAYRLWEAEFDRLRKSDFFESIGTYAVDSATTLMDALMNEILKRAGRAGGTPQKMDWMVQMNCMRDIMKLFTTLPCNCILIAHVDNDKDEATGKMFNYPMMTGKLKRKVPLLFDEIYAAQSKATSKGTEYSLLTQNDGLWQARTRIGRDGIFEKYEVPDIRLLLKKAGMPYEDIKPKGGEAK